MKNGISKIFYENNGTGTPVDGAGHLVRTVFVERYLTLISRALPASIPQQNAVQRATRAPCLLFLCAYEGPYENRSRTLQPARQTRAQARPPRLPPGAAYRLRREPVPPFRRAYALRADGVRRWIDDAINDVLLRDCCALATHPLHHAYLPAPEPARTCRRIATRLIALRPSRYARSTRTSRLPCHHQPAQPV